MDIQHDADAHRFSTLVEGHTAVIDYVLDENVMTLTHTGVPDAIGGRGIAAALMRAALTTARRSGWKVYPACSYAAAYLAKHPEDADLLVRGSAGPSRHEDELIDESIEESFPASDPPSVGESS
jgi:predicted GNAT family acetyltransferase